MWDKEFAIAEKAARESGKILRQMYGKVTLIQKKGEIDLVTDADLRSERVILDLISEHFPQDNILAEEAGARERPSNRTWLVDPLDGTTNFAHGFPFFAVSVALEVERDLALGIVYHPLMEEFFWAVKGRGAFLNGMELKTSQTRKLTNALLGTGFPYDVHTRPERVMELFRKMLLVARGVRRPGSAAIDLCYVAAGRFDGFWEEGLKPWDTAAGSLIVTEAGGKLSTLSGQDYSPYKKSIVASNPFIHQPMLDILNA